MKKNIIIFISLAFSSCVATQNDMLLLQSQIDDLNSNLSTLQKNQADLSVKIDNLNSSLNIFSENMKDLSKDINSLSAKIDEFGNLTDKKINVIGQSIKKQQEEMEKNLLPAKLYSLAMNDYSAKNYDAAIEKFKNYVTKYPDSENIHNAYFYIAESLYEKKDYSEAGIFYAKILDKYPDYPKTPAVRFKYAMSLLNLKDPAKKEEAERYLKSIIKDYPATPEAKVAKDFFDKQKTKQETHKISHPKSQKN